MLSSPHCEGLKAPAPTTPKTDAGPCALPDHDARKEGFPQIVPGSLIVHMTKQLTVFVVSDRTLPRAMRESFLS